MYVKRLAVTGFWGRMTAETELHSDVTIFIGANGTGKTTLINLLVAGLKADIEALNSWQFESIRIELIDPEQPNRLHSIIIRRVRDVSPTMIEYIIGDKRYLLDRPRSVAKYVAVNLESVLGADPRRNDIRELRDKLAALVNLSWIAVHRYVPTDREDDPSVARQMAVDQRLNSLLGRLAKLQLKIESKAQGLSKEFQSSVLSLILYRPDLDNLVQAMEAARKTDLQGEEHDLVQAMSELGLEVDRARIRVHFEKLRQALALTQVIYQKKSMPDSGDLDILSLPILLRTRYIIEELKNVETKRDELRRPLRAFLSVVGSFVAKKHFWFDAATSDLRVAVDWKKTRSEIKMRDLSSGEKQLLIQLLEVLLQEERPAVLVADEPELSLHVSWQEKLLAALRSINDNAQIVVATHSPDIVGAFRHRVIDMEDVVRG